MKDVEGLGATCTEDGHTAYKRCYNCSAKLGLETLPATGHNYVDYICTGCGDDITPPDSGNSGSTGPIVGTGDSEEIE